MDYSTKTFYLSCSECKAEATLTATDLLAAELLTRRPSWCKCFSPSHTKLVPGMLKSGKDQA